MRQETQKILKDRNLENEDIFELIKNPPEVGALGIFEQPELWDTSIGPTQAVTTQGIATIYLPSGPLSMDGAQWHLLQHTTHLDERWPQATRIMPTKRTYTTDEARPGLKT